jgi:hypothetical protein
MIFKKKMNHRFYEWYAFQSPNQRTTSSLGWLPFI